MKGFIYKIYDNTNGNCYYGSTKSILSKRLHSHKGSYKAYLKGKSGYCYSYKIIENGNYDISLVEEVEYENKQELHARERDYIENNDCVNKQLPNFDNKKYSREYYLKTRDKNRDEMSKQKKEYYQLNKVKILEKSKKYYNEHTKLLIKENVFYKKLFSHITLSIMDTTEKTEDSGNLINPTEFYTLESIKGMIPMLDDVSYHKLYLRINIQHLTEKEIEEEELLIKRLSMNVANMWKNNVEKFENNKVEEVEE